MYLTKSILPILPIFLGGVLLISCQEETSFTDNASGHSSIMGGGMDAIAGESQNDDGLNTSGQDSDAVVQEGNLNSGDGSIGGSSEEGSNAGNSSDVVSGIDNTSEIGESGSNGNPTASNPTTPSSPTNPTTPDTGDTDGPDVGDTGGEEPEDDMTFACLTSSSIVDAGRSLTLRWDIPTSYGDVELRLSTDSGEEGPSLGTISGLNNGSAQYLAPDSIASYKKVHVDAVYNDLGTEKRARCEVALKADEDIGVPDDGALVGLTGDVYVIPIHQPKLPDYSQMVPVDKLVVPNLDIPERQFDTGFPGVKDLYEWFGIQFKGRINAPHNGFYEFKLTSDDGSNLYIDGKLVVDNDGIHQTESSSEKTFLTKGYHDIRIDYYQGPADRIGLQLFWKTSLLKPFEIIPANRFSRPLE